MPPWGLAGGIVGLPPKVGWGVPPDRRNQIDSLADQFGQS